LAGSQTFSTFVFAEAQRFGKSGYPEAPQFANAGPLSPFKTFCGTEEKV
jgi:hypothetical protein